MAAFTLYGSAAAPIETVFDVLTDHRAYAGFTPLRSTTLEREGDLAPDGVGAIRVLKLLGPPIREEVTVYEPPTQFSYRMLSGIPVREHVGVVELRAEAGRTRVEYRVETTPKLPVPPGVWVALNKPAINQLLKGIIKESEQRARSGA